MCACTFGEIQVILDEGVLRADAATRHARTTLGAPGPLGAGTTEERVGCGLATVTEVDAHRSRGERVAHAHVLGDLLHDLVRGSDRRVRLDPEHPTRLVVVRIQLTLPVRDGTPLRVLEELRRRLVQRVGVVERASADACPRHHQHVGQQMDTLDAVAAERRSPQVLTQTPTGLGQFVIGEPSAGFQHRHPVALLDGPQRGNAAAEPGADDQYVVVAHAETAFLSDSRVSETSR